MVFPASAVIFAVAGYCHPVQRGYMHCKRQYGMAFSSKSGPDKLSKAASPLHWSMPGLQGSQHKSCHTPLRSGETLPVLHWQRLAGDRK
ncbi:hypothetical protein SBC1_10960 [Caballeronia sp. SBC1]|nr:hypothetical protein SBC2_12370 [Caballeronia sp. SBC2]QIN61111.1 hypothetical protein SBC1_10960 [Caballeronia sp. SBC1]